ncbi:hypothetical protein HY448_00625 [Candidatus Pacearchaeota archaeon]|nr:hypothetical protein [Candidatus Pacearchaeota archaeon]
MGIALTAKISDFLEAEENITREITEAFASEVPNIKSKTHSMLPKGYSYDGLFKVLRQDKGPLYIPGRNKRLVLKYGDFGVELNTPKRHSNGFSLSLWLLPITCGTLGFQETEALNIFMNGEFDRIEDTHGFRVYGFSYIPRPTI